MVPPDIFLRRLRAALRENRKGEGRGHVRAGPLLTGAVEKGEGHGDAAPLRPPWPLPLGAAKRKEGKEASEARAQGPEAMAWRPDRAARGPVAAGAAARHELRERRRKNGC